MLFWRHINQLSLEIMSRSKKSCNMSDRRFCMMRFQCKNYKCWRQPRQWAWQRSMMLKQQRRRGQLQRRNALFVSRMIWDLIIKKDMVERWLAFIWWILFLKFFWRTRSRCHCALKEMHICNASGSCQLMFTSGTTADHVFPISCRLGTKGTWPLFQTFTRSVWLWSSLG